jgi:prepilin-type N-terminal cleavage/methylation domain-containing protein
MSAFSRTLHTCRRGFTLIEILVAIAILVIVGLGLSQILSLALQTWQQGLIRADCFTKARVVLDSATADIQRGLFRSDLYNFPNSTSSPPTFTFYTRAAGVSAGNSSIRPVSLVTYQLAPANANLPGYLLRSETPVIWTGTGANLHFYQPLPPVIAATASAPVPPNDLLSTGIVDFEMLFLLSDGTTIPANAYKTPSTASVVMIGLTVAVIDDKVLTLLHPTTTSQLSNIQKTLENTISTTSTNFAPMTIPSNSTTYISPNYDRSIKELWDPAIAPLFQNAGYPKSLATGLQTFERFVPCTPFN